MPEAASQASAPTVADVAFRPWSEVPLLPRLIATAAGSGFLRPASGTWGSVAATIPAWAWLTWAPTDWITPGLAIGVVLATFAGVWSSNVCIRTTGIEDPGPVVIDEVAGVWATLLLVPPAVAVASPLLASIVGFLSFRLFDIVKPWPISALERFPRGWGVMADDLGAGILAGVLAGAALR